MRARVALATLCSAVLTAGPAVAQQRPAPAADRGVAAAAPVAAPLRLVAALVLADLSVRPVPLHAIELIAEADSSVRRALRTGLDGTIAQAVIPGRYRVRSVQPAALNDSSYRWDLVVDVAAGGAQVELTNANAATAAATRQVARQVAPEREVYERVRRGVFRIEPGLGHGSGFLIGAEGGLVVTNDHVIGTTSSVSVYLDSATRVPAQVVLRDQDADLAILRLPAGRCADCPRLPLADPREGEPLVVAGERLFAIGFPLNQEMTLTSGIASSVRDGAIISDVNINSGNSGGPMLNLAGEVVAVNTFVDNFRSVGPGVSGAVAVYRLRPLLDEARTALAELPELQDDSMTTMPRTVYPMAVLKAFADTATPDAYRHLAGRDAGRFVVSLSIPTQQLVFRKQYENTVGRDRKRREAKAGIAADERYSELKEQRDWMEYVGSATAPVVAVLVEPKVGETGGSMLGRGLAAGLVGARIQAQLKFQGDVRGVRLYRNGEEVAPIRGGHTPQKVLLENEWVALKDVADMGYYLYPPEAFAPDSLGVPPRVTVVVQDLKNPKSLSSVDIWGGTAARVWNDFGPYFQALHPSQPWTRADRELKSPNLDLRCTPQSGECALRR